MLLSDGMVHFLKIKKNLVALIKFAKLYTVEPRYNEVLGTMKITLLYQVSHYIRVKKQRNIKSWDQQNYLVIRGFCYIRPLYNEVPLYNYLYIFESIAIHVFNNHSHSLEIKIECTHFHSRQTKLLSSYLNWQITFIFCIYREKCLWIIINSYSNIFLKIICFKIAFSSSSSIFSFHHPTAPMPLFYGGGGGGGGCSGR